MATAATLAPTPEQTKVATQQFERANQAISSQNLDYGIELLQTCCQLDPANLIYRKRLRHIQKTKYGNSLRGSPMAWLTTYFTRRRLRTCFRRKEDREVLVLGETVLSKDPWEIQTQLLMGQAAERLGMRQMAVFIVEQARQKNPHDPKVNKPLAQLYERLGAFTQAIAAWQLVAKYAPSDRDALGKAKDLAAMHTIQKGGYEERSHTSAEGEDKAGTTEGTLDETATNAHGTQVEFLSTQEYLQKAQAHRQAKEWEQARQVLQEGVQATRGNFELQQALTDLEIEPFRQDLLLTRQRLKAEPENAELRDHQDQLRKEIVNREMAYHRQRADRFPQDMKARLELGIRLLQLEQMDEAVAELQLARRDPQYRAKALVHLGLAFMAKGNWSLAKRNLDEALILLPATETVTRKEVLYQLALGAAEQKDWKLALQYGHDCASIDYKYKNIRLLLLDWQQNGK